MLTYVRNTVGYTQPPFRVGPFIYIKCIKYRTKHFVNDVLNYMIPVSFVIFVVDIIYSSLAQPVVALDC